MSPPVAHGVEDLGDGCNAEKCLVRINGGALLKVRESIPFVQHDLVIFDDCHHGARHVCLPHAVGDKVIDKRLQDGSIAEQIRERLGVLACTHQAGGGG